MNDMSQVIIPRSDQINADTLLAGPMTVTVKEVKITGGQEQPVSIYLEETDLAYRPCKSMSRCLVAAWGPDASKYAGRRLTLYRDASVKWAGMEVGGIRISHMSHIEGEKLMMLTATKGSRKPHKVLPLPNAPTPAATEDKAAKWAASYITKLATFATSEALDAFALEKAAKLTELREARPELADDVLAAHTKRQGELQAAEQPSDEDAFA